MILSDTSFTKMGNELPANTTDISICHIAPVNHLNMSKKGQALFLLSHLFRDNDTRKKYSEYVKHSNQYKILDNSVHENQEVSLSEYFLLASKYNVDEIILQDVLKDFHATQELKEKQLQDYVTYLDPNTKIHICVQGRDIKEILASFDAQQNDNRIDVIGIPFGLTPRKFSKNHYLNLYLNRRYILHTIGQYIKHNKIIPKPIHLLGMTSWEDVLLKREYPWIRSIDSNLCSRFAKSKIMLDDMPIGKPSTKIDFKEQFDINQKKYYTRNINRLNEIKEQYGLW